MTQAILREVKFSSMAVRQSSRDEVGIERRTVFTLFRSGDEQGILAILGRSSDVRGASVFFLINVVTSFLGQATL